MKTPKLANALNFIEDELILEAEYQKKSHKALVKWGSLAASFVVLVVAIAVSLPSLFNDNVIPVKPENSETTYPNKAESQENIDSEKTETEPNNSSSDISSKTQSNEIVTSSKNSESSSATNSSETNSKPQENSTSNSLESQETSKPNASEKEDTKKNPQSKYKDYSVNIMSTAILWPWEYQTLSEKYTETEIDGIKYRIYSGFSISKNVLDQKLGTFDITGYDNILTDKYYTEVFDVYSIKTINKEQFIAVQMEDEYFVFKNDVYNPPQTLGELFQKIDLSDLVELNRYSENSSGPEADHYILNNDDYIWEILKTCENATFLGEEEYFHPYDRDFISFTVSSEKIGMRKHSFLITEDGYLETNIFSWRLLYEIGEEASQKILKYVKANSLKTEYVPYMNTLAGTVTEITKDYILIDDSILCNNEEDGITYKLPIDSIKISRNIDRGVIEVGDTVQVSFRDELNSQNTITSFYSITKAKITFGDISIPE